MARWNYITEDDDLVDEGFECPHCGERRVDQLVICDGWVECDTCGQGYEVAK